VFTIDPATARHLDDALSVKVIGEGESACDVISFNCRNAVKLLIECSTCSLKNTTLLKINFSKYFMHYLHLLHCSKYVYTILDILNEKYSAQILRN